MFIRQLSTITKVSKLIMNRMSTATAAAPEMFCFQCEQTKDRTGCTTVGVCGKDASTAGLQDLQLHFNIGIGQWAHAIESRGGEVPEAVNAFLLDSTFATLTNVNFDSSRFYEYMSKANELRSDLRKQAISLGVDPKSLVGPAHFEYLVCIEYIFSFY